MARNLEGRLAQIESDIAALKKLLLPTADRCKLTQTERDILDALGSETLPGKEVADRAGYGYDTVRHHLSTLKKRGRIEHIDGEGYRRIDVNTP